ncbi:alpha/beta fold hydrolase [Formicincola oecophyllae]|uniref:Alpha/beta fold hydrolase n=1 Tax=Formicincola oecophyllae TaxID=2558361 RepID=A0A4Y6UAR5_9PROT|nr:alpha/beta fold hydrolase [Formicincola oecophyllae]QDH13556.1 alpha/beta fold hydrolase [Formicincola oecophyllae]
MRLASYHRTETSSPHAPAVLLLHGVLGRGRNMGQLQRALAPHCRTWALDLRSHGESPAGPLSYQAMATDVLETMDSLGLNQAYIIGHSMGGKTAMAIALTAPERVQGLVVGDIAPLPISNGHAALAQTLAQSPLPPLADHKAVQDYFKSFTNSEALVALLGQNVRPDRTGKPAQWQCSITDIAAGFKNVEDWPAQLTIPHVKPYEGPTLFVRGAHSNYIDGAGVQALKDLFPQAHLETIPQAGHWLHVEQPDLFQKIVLNFLASQSPHP